jgi:anti-sigma factor ChrR (cupin superfamily)|tara:strand:- start:181 stop:528 length:348 start_codon:yes stop_codon:yes gene_type:complete
MAKRKITDLYNLKFEPFDNYGSVVPGMSWYKISYNRDAGGQGTYVLKMDPGSKSLPHEHTGYEEFLMLDGELTDPDGKVFKKGDFITFYPGSTHSSYTKDGCLVLVFMRGINKPI